MTALTNGSYHTRGFSSYRHIDPIKDAKLALQIISQEIGSHSEELQLIESAIELLRKQQVSGCLNPMKNLVAKFLEAHREQSQEGKWYSHAGKSDRQG